MPNPLQYRQDAAVSTIFAGTGVVDTATLDPSSTKLVFNTAASTDTSPPASFSVSFSGVGGTLTTAPARATTTSAPEESSSQAQESSGTSAPKDPISLGAVIGAFLAVAVAFAALLGFFCWRRKKEKLARALARERKRNRASSFVGGSPVDTKREGPWEEFKSGPDTYQEPFPGPKPEPSTIYTSTNNTFIGNPAPPRRPPTIKSMGKVNPSNNFASGSDEEDDDDPALRLPLSPTSARVHYRDNIQQKYGTVMRESEPPLFPPPLPMHRDGPTAQPTPQPKRTLTLRSHKGAASHKKSKDGNSIALHNIIAALDSHTLSPQPPHTAALSDEDDRSYYSASPLSAAYPVADPFQDPELAHQRSPPNATGTS